MIKNRIYVISRDGKSINDFLDRNNLTKDDIYIVKNSCDLVNADNSKYVVIRPFPLSFYWSMLPIMRKKNMINITRRFK